MSTDSERPGPSDPDGPAGADDAGDADGPPGPASDRVRLRRGAIRAEYDRAAIFAVLDAGLVAHVGVTTQEGPIVLPMAYGRTDEWLYVHGSVANHALRAAVGADICITVTILDGLVVGRTPFHNSMNYRGVVVRGTARRVDDPAEHMDALRLVSDHVVATWDTGRPPSEAEIRKTMVIALALTEMSAKIRAGDPIDEPGDLDGPHWGGHVPLTATWAAPVDSSDLPAGVAVPAAIAALRGRPLP
jgi:nitroimidazol reductase NimA-like FMN-containing flavoprotein (pyridoxamine 5'-phosphate oxidase superfamily)